MKDKKQDWIIFQKMVGARIQPIRQLRLVFRTHEVDPPPRLIPRWGVDKLSTTKNTTDVPLPLVVWISRDPPLPSKKPLQKGVP